MPVLDHEIHPSTQIGDDYRWGCWNKERPRIPQTCQDGWTSDGRRRLVSFPAFGADECRNDSSLKDPNCRGCKFVGTGEKYDQMVRSKGK